MQFVEGGQDMIVLAGYSITDYLVGQITWRETRTKLMYRRLIKRVLILPAVLCLALPGCGSVDVESTVDARGCRWRW